MKIGEIIREYRMKHGMTQLEFAIKSGYTPGYISLLEIGDKNKSRKPISPTAEAMSKLADAMNISVYRLLEMLDDDQTITIEKAKQRQAKFLPVIGTIACGSPILAEENFRDYVPAPEGMRADFALTCSGDSMTGARIDDGDTVYIRIQPEVETGEIAAVLIGEEATLKRVYKDGDSLILCPDNPAYKPIVITGADQSEVRIMGKAVGCLKYFER